MKRLGRIIQFLEFLGLRLSMGEWDGGVKCFKDRCKIYRDPFF